MSADYPSMTTAEIRSKFLNFFEERGLKLYPSSSLVPDDPSLLLANAGMNQFKEYYQGKKTMKEIGAISCQKCVRTNDIDCIGEDGRHLSFFEMLGDFSFGGVSKQQACAWAFELITKTAKAKFDETVELHVKLGVDSRHADQQVRGAIVLPHGTGKTVRVLVFAKGDKADAAREAGADYVGDMDMVEKIQKENWFDFDVVVATPDMMGVVGRLGKVLGPKGLMPSPKAGTVTMDVTKAINEIKAGKVEYRLDKTNIIHCPIGKVSFGAEKLAENFNAIMGAIVKAKPAAAKGQYLSLIHI